MPFNTETGLFDGYIYCIENATNHKKYIGQTIASVRERFWQHISSMRAGVDTYLYNSMRLYGLENFTISTLCVASESNHRELLIRLNELESLYITSLDTYAPHGYNMTLGGRSFSEPSSRSVAMVSYDGDVLEIYPTIRCAAEMNGMMEKNIQKACNSKSHFSGGFFWYPADDVKCVGDNIGKQQRGVNNWSGHITYPGKRVRMLSRNGDELAVFNSASEASRKLNISQAAISKCCVGKRKSAGGYLWTFLL